jgi:hypothetical protein
LGSDIYHSLQTTVRKRFTHGFTTQLAYTYSHDISMNTSILIPQYRNYDRYTTSIDRTHSLVLSSTYELPFGANKQYLQHGILAQVAGGWTINGLFTHYSGIPFYVTSSGNSCNCPGNTQTANQVLPNVAIVGNGLNGQAYFNPLAFAPVNTAAFGNEGFNSLRGPGATNIDLNIFRDFKLTERFKLEIRGESFNLSNTPHFANPGTNVSNLQLNADGSVKNLNGYDQITAVNALGRLIDARYFRFGLRVMF